MGKTTRGRSNVGRGKVTAVQIAYIVDRYLTEHNFSKTLIAFRSEASELLPKRSLQEAARMLSLEAMMNEYITLKELKVSLNQEKSRVERENLRVQTLLQGMQDVMNAYNSGATTAACLTTPPSATAQPSSATAVVPSSAAGPAYRTPVMASVSMTHSVKVDHANFSTSLVTSRPPRKRKIYKDTLEAPPAPKRISGPMSNNQLTLNKGRDSAAVQSNNASNGDCVRQQSPCPESSVPNYAQAGSPPIQGSSVAKHLFNKPSDSPTSNSSGPKTPPRAASSQSDKSISPLEEVSSTAKSRDNDTHMQTTPTNCTIISSKTIIVSPVKHFSIERNQCTFSSPSKSSLKRQNKREHVKGRLDFDGSESDMPNCLDNTAVNGDGSSTSESEKEGDLFDLDIPNFDHAFGPDFSLTELLTDFGIDCGTFDISCPTTSGTSADAVPNALCENSSGDLGTSPDMVEHSSSVTEVFAGDINQIGGEAMTAVKSVTKCITILSPSKSTRNCSANDQEKTSELIS